MLLQNICILLMWTIICNINMWGFDDMEKWQSFLDFACYCIYKYIDKYTNIFKQNTTHSIYHIIIILYITILARHFLSSYNISILATWIKLPLTVCCNLSRLTFIFILYANMIGIALHMCDYSVKNLFLNSGFCQRIECARVRPQSVRNVENSIFKAIEFMHWM